MAHAARVAGYDPATVRVTVLRRSLDARKGHLIGFHLEVAIWPLDVVEPEVETGLPPPIRARAGAHVVVVGTGPCGTYAALRLTDAGARVTLVDVGKPVQPRRHDLASLTQRGALDPDSNYCFGEGGAGTFSDGKLYTRTKDKRAVRSVLHALCTHGADPEILVDSRPHVGSNRLPKILMAQRADLEARGATYIWSDGVTDLLLADGRVTGVRCVSGRENRRRRRRPRCGPFGAVALRAAARARRGARGQGVRRRSAGGASATAHRSHPVWWRLGPSAAAGGLLSRDGDGADARCRRPRRLQLLHVPGRLRSSTRRPSRACCASTA